MSDEIDGAAGVGKKPGEQEEQPSMEPLTEELKTADDHSQLVDKTPLPIPPTETSGDSLSPSPTYYSSG